MAILESPSAEHSGAPPGPPGHDRVSGTCCHPWLGSPELGIITVITCHHTDHHSALLSALCSVTLSDQLHQCVAVAVDRGRILLAVDRYYEI